MPEVYKTITTLRALIEKVYANQPTSLESVYAFEINPNISVGNSKKLYRISTKNFTGQWKTCKELCSLLETAASTLNK